MRSSAITHALALAGGPCEGFVWRCVNQGGRQNFDHHLHVMVEAIAVIGWLRDQAQQFEGVAAPPRNV